MGKGVEHDVPQSERRVCTKERERERDRVERERERETETKRAREGEGGEEGLATAGDPRDVARHRRLPGAPPDAAAYTLLYDAILYI